MNSDNVIFQIVIPDTLIPVRPGAAVVLFQNSKKRLLRLFQRVAEFQTVPTEFNNT